MKKRRQPITKPNSAAVFSYYTTNREGKSLQKKQRFAIPAIGSKKFWSRLGVILIGIGLIGYLTYLSDQPILRTPAGQALLRPSAQYQTALQQLLNGSVLNHNKLTIRSAAIAAKLRQQYPELLTVNVQTDLIGNRPVVKLQYQPAAWRLQTKGQLWLLDDQGRVLGQTTDGLISGSGLPLIDDQIGLTPQAGKQLLAASDVQFLSQVTAYLKAKQLIISQFILPAVPREMDVRLSGDKYYYKLNLDQSADWQAGTLLAARETLTRVSAVPTAYVDLRASEKAFWK